MEPPAPVRVPSQRLLAPSVTSVANDMDDNEMIPGAVHRSPGICLTVEKNPGKRQLGDRLMKELCDLYRLKWGPFPPNEIGRIAQLVKEGDGRKEGYGRQEILCPSLKRFYNFLLIENTSVSFAEFNEIEYNIFYLFFICKMWVFFRKIFSTIHVLPD